VDIYGPKSWNATLTLIQGDITNVEADSIVNAANATLLGGLGVMAQSTARADRKILEECKRIRANEWPGWITHSKRSHNHRAVTSKPKKDPHGSPVWRGGFYDEAKLLRQAYWNSHKTGCCKWAKSVAFPSISTGSYRLSHKQKKPVALQ
jgi:O-acetyl-ADP-ribose deacetylase (regulator of RNase III)